MLELHVSNTPNIGDCLVGYKGQYTWVSPKIIAEAYTAGVVGYQAKLEELIEGENNELQS